MFRAIPSIFQKKKECLVITSILIDSFNRSSYHSGISYYNLNNRSLSGHEAVTHQHWLTHVTCFERVRMIVLFFNIRNNIDMLGRVAGAQVYPYLCLYNKKWRDAWHGMHNIFMSILHYDFPIKILLRHINPARYFSLQPHKLAPGQARPPFGVVSPTG